MIFLTLEVAETSSRFNNLIDQTNSENTNSSFTELQNDIWLAEKAIFDDL